jgi:hypothetical protein
MHNWETSLLGFTGWKMKLLVEDAAGEHHSPARFYTLAKVTRTEDKELRLYLNELQFVAVPLFFDGDTTLEITPSGGLFRSQDRKANLIYSAEFYL